MRPIFLLLIASLVFTVPVRARDFIVEFVAEHYKETDLPYSRTPQIYHSIQVKSNAGPKLLVLTGDDLEYRRWIRQYISQDKHFMVKVPDQDNDRFIASKVYEVDVVLLHPFEGSKWAPGTQGLVEGDEAGPVRGAQMLHGDRHIMIIDRNTKRSSLITSVINRMGYTAMVSRNGEQALRLFRAQPEKFRMIITYHDIPGMDAEIFIDNLLKVDHQIPILVETGYNNNAARDRFITRFSGAGTVKVRPVVLDNLQNTIKQLVKPEEEKG